MAWGGFMNGSLIHWHSLTQFTSFQLFTVLSFVFLLLATLTFTSTQTLSQSRSPFREARQFCLSPRLQLLAAKQFPFSTNHVGESLADLGGLKSISQVEVGRRICWHSDRLTHLGLCCPTRRNSTPQHSYSEPGPLTQTAPTEETSKKGHSCIKYNSLSAEKRFSKYLNAENVCSSEGKLTKVSDVLWGCLETEIWQISVWLETPKSFRFVHFTRSYKGHDSRTFWCECCYWVLIVPISSNFND